MDLYSPLTGYIRRCGRSVICWLSKTDFFVMALYSAGEDQMGLRQISGCFSARSPHALVRSGVSTVRISAQADVMLCDRLRPRWAPRAPLPTPQAPPLPPSTSPPPCTSLGERNHFGVSVVLETGCSPRRRERLLADQWCVTKISLVLSCRDKRLQIRPLVGNVDERVIILDKDLGSTPFILFQHQINFHQGAFQYTRR